MPAPPRVVHEAPTEFPITPTDGYWEWKDDTGMRYVSYDKSKGKKNAAGFVRQSGLQGTGYSVGLTSVLLSLKKQNTVASGQPGLKKENTAAAVQSDERISLDHVKEVALELSEIRVNQQFNEFINSQSFHNFAISLFVYFENYFKIVEMDNQPRGMVAEMSAVEQVARENAMTSLTSAEKSLGFNYSILILGLELPDQHHMSCGSSRVSSLQKDRQQFEKLYTYATYLVWVCFKRSIEIETIRTEVGRILKSNYFNSCARASTAQHISFTQRAKSNDSTYLKAGAANNMMRKDLVKRPPIMAIVNQKSPAVISLLPSTKEQSSWLFNKLNDETVKKHSRSSDDSDIRDSTSPHKTNATMPSKVGIIGESLLKFNSKTLMPLEAEKKTAAEMEKENIAAAKEKDDLSLPMDMVSVAPAAAAVAAIESEHVETNDG